MKNKENSKISILIVPHTKKVRRIIIPHWLPKASILSFSTLLIILMIYIVGNYTYQRSLRLETNEKSSIIDELEEANKIKDLELASIKLLNDQLFQKTTEVEAKLTEIDSLQRRLEQIADIKSPSRGGPISRDINNEGISKGKEMDVIGEVLEDKKIELEAFIEDLEIQFEYLESVPDLMPTVGKLTSKFGNRRDPFSRRIQFHQGIDIANSRGTNIISSGKGIVMFSGYKSGYGRTIIVDHGNKYKTLYAHCNKLLVNVGDKVDKGQLIAKMGSTGRSTGNHLHFEIQENNKTINPYNILK